MSCAVGEMRMGRDNVEEFRPLGGTARVRHVSSDEDEIQGPDGVQGVKAGHDTFQPDVAARAGPPALHAKAVAFADNMDVGKMSHPPDPLAQARGVERLEIERLLHRRIGEAPHERRQGQIGRHDHDGVGERRQNELMGDRQIGSRADPARRRPRGERDQRRDGEEE